MKRNIFEEYFLWLMKFVSGAFILFITFFICIAFIGEVMSKVSEMDPSVGNLKHKFAKKKVALINIKGEIIDSRSILDKLYTAYLNENIDGIVVRVDSPGGGVAPSQDIYNLILKIKKNKPVVASFGSVAASGGYYIGAAANKIYAQTGTLTGSIGVIMPIVNATELAKKVGVKYNPIISGRFKDIGNPLRDMRQEEKKLLYDNIMTIYNQFLTDVSKARNIPINKLKLYADGRIMNGIEAKKVGLIDEFGDIYDAAREAYALSGNPLKEDQVPNIKEMRRWNYLIGEFFASTFSWVFNMMGNNNSVIARY